MMIGKVSTGRLARRAASTALLSGSIVVLVAAMTQLLLDTRAMRLHPPPGEVMQSGHFALHLHERGIRGRGPTVILDAGGGSFSAQWGWIAPALAEHAHVVAYDRPGLGWSRPSALPEDGYEVARALAAALRARGIEGPYVMVGHSFGSVMIRVFAQQFPGDVAGLVHVDPRYLRMEPVVGEDVLREGARMQRWLPMLARLGAARLANPARGMVGTLPAREAAQGLAMFVSTAHLSAMANEWPMSNRTVDRLAAVGENLGDLPNIVLSAGAPDEYFHGERRSRFTETQRALAALSTRGEHRVVAGADHYTIVTDRGHAASVTDAVLGLLAVLRQTPAAGAAPAGSARPPVPGPVQPDLSRR